MSRARIQINELRLRATGLTREEARRLGETVAQRLAESPLTNERSQRIATLTVRVQSGGNQSIDRMADDIARNVRRGVN